MPVSLCVFEISLWAYEFVNNTSGSEIENKMLAIREEMKKGNSVRLYNLTEIFITDIKESEPYKLESFNQQYLGETFVDDDLFTRTDKK